MAGWLRSVGGSRVDPPFTKASGSVLARGAPASLRSSAVAALCRSMRMMAGKWPWPELNTIHGSDGTLME